MKRLLSLIVTATLTGALLLGAGTSTATASTPAGGTIHIYATPSATNQALDSILITGVIGDYGKALTVDKNGKTDANGNYVDITLQKGSFKVNSTTLNKKTNSAQPNIDKTTCSFWFSGTGPVTLFDGTGSYLGISGKLNITITFAGYGPLYTSGKHKGTCNLSNNAQPTNQYSSITGSGTVTF